MSDSLAKRPSPAGDSHLSFLFSFFHKLSLLKLTFRNTEISHKFGLNYQKVFSGNLFRIDQFSFSCAWIQVLHSVFCQRNTNPPLLPHIRMQQLLKSIALWSSTCTSDAHSQDTGIFIFCLKLLF